MARIGNTKIQKIGDSNYILVPAKVLKDKSFPLKENSEGLIIRISGKRLVVEAYGEK